MNRNEHGRPAGDGSVIRKFLMMVAWGFQHINQIKLYQAIEPIKTQLGLITIWR